jgi:hypothetical protein
LGRVRHPERRLGFPGKRSPWRNIRAHARFQFLVAIEKLVPAVLQDLSELPRPAGSIRPRRSALLDWADDHNLKTNWVLAYATETYVAWRIYGGPLTWHDTALDNPAYWPEVKGRTYPNPDDQFSSGTERNLEQFEWLARYQVMTEPYYAIAKSVGADVSNVRAAVRSLADLIKLPLRSPNARGRPRTDD